MILYHFCCERDMKGIRNKGITLGCVAGEILVPGQNKWQHYIRPGWQWLTLDGDRKKQSWATKHLIRYDRTEYRYTVEIPEKDETQIYDRERLVNTIPGSDSLYDGWAGSENWRVYRGPIPKKYLKKLERWNKETESWEDCHLWPQRNFT